MSFDTTFFVLFFGIFFGYILGRTVQYYSTDGKVYAEVSPELLKQLEEEKKRLESA